MMKTFVGPIAAMALLIGLVLGATPVGASVDSATLVPTPAPGSASYLRSVDCLTVTTCIAVGDTYDGSVTEPLIESWDGTSWVVIPSPTLPYPASRLGGVSCVDPSFCAAVGDYFSSFDGDHALTEIWDGTSWSEVDSPDGGTATRLKSVSCVSATFCIAVGQAAGGTLTVAERWDGTAWSVMQTANPEAYNALTSVSCVSEDFCIAVGYSGGNGSPEARSTVWDGSQWSAVAISNLGPGSSAESVSCLTTTFCMFTGLIMGQPSQGITGFWDGSAWTLDPSFVVDPAIGIYLDSVDCVSEQSCTVVGGRYLLNGKQEPVMVNWDGTGWTEITAPIESEKDYSELYSVSCSSPWRCMAVGYFEPVGPDVTLSIELTGPEPPPSTTSTTAISTTTTAASDPIVPVFAG